MKRFVLLVIFTLSVAASLVPSAKTCALDATLREYLSALFWQPLAKFAQHYRFAQRKEIEPRPYAGMGETTTPGTVAEVRKAYAVIADPSSNLNYLDFPTQLQAARAAIDAALRTNLTEEQREEVRLVECKVDMRQGETGDEEALLRAEHKLKQFLRTARKPAFSSEARGWLARVYYLQGRFAPAAKIYLDELGREDSNLTRRSLLISIRTLFPYNGTSARLEHHLEEYFDSTAHALFVVNLVTNPIYRSDSADRKEMAAVGQKVIRALDRHPELFKGPDGDAFSLALMRASLYMGDAAAAIRYSRRVKSGSEASESPEYQWMLATSYYLQRNFDAAEAPLLRIVSSLRADPRDKVAAAQGLMGVYFKLRRPVDQLYAAFLHNAHMRKLWDTARETHDERQFYMGYPAWAEDDSYLLDTQMTAAELEQYLVKYPRPIEVDGIETLWAGSQTRRRTEPELVKYALAVRRARQEDYAKAAELYQSISAWPRARRMRLAEKLYRRAHDETLGHQAHLEAQYQYGAFLADHPVAVFFNDSLWNGHQTAFMIEAYRSEQYYFAKGGSGLTGAEREQFIKRERQLRDEQEERWRAYSILSKVAEHAGHSTLGRRAARKAIDALVMINSDRFGRKAEIEAAIRRWNRWLSRAGTLSPAQKTAGLRGVEKWSAVPGLRKLRPGLYSSAQPKSGRAGPL